MAKASVCVLGAGVTGLSTAYQLINDGYKVTIVARDFPGDVNTNWASPWAGALLAPYPGGDVVMQRESIDTYRSLLAQDPACSVQALPITEYYDDREHPSEIWYRDYFDDFKFIPASDLPQGAKIGFTYTGFVLNPTIFMPWIFNKLVEKGAKFIKTEVARLEEAHDLSGADFVVNASGLGAEQLVPDPSVTPVRGQTMLVKSAHNQVTIYQGREYTYVIPRPGSGQVVLGGISQHGSTDVNVDASLRADILRRVNRLTNDAFSWVDLDKDVTDIVAFRPGREGGMRVERVGTTVHTYGGGSLGYMYAHGVAKAVHRLIKDSSPSTSRLSNL